MGGPENACGSVTAKRQLRWIVWGTPSARFRLRLATRSPCVWLTPALMELSRALIHPDRFESAIVSYADGLKESSSACRYKAGWARLQWSTCCCSEPRDGYDVNGRRHRWMIAFLTTHRPPQTRSRQGSMQSTSDREFYRGRYDYRRALVAFAPISTRSRYNRIAEVTSCASGRRTSSSDGDHAATRPTIEPMKRRASKSVPKLSAASAIGAAFSSGHVVRIEDRSPWAVSRRSGVWRDEGVYIRCPASRTQAIACSMGARKVVKRCRAKTWRCSRLAGQQRPHRNGRLYGSCN